MPEFRNNQPPIAEQLSAAVTSIQDEAFDLTEKVYGSAAILNGLDLSDTELEIILGLSDEEYEALNASLDNSTPEEFAGLSDRYEAHQKSSPQEFQGMVLARASRVFGQINGFTIDLHGSSAAEIIFSRFLESSDTEFGDDTIDVRYELKRLVLDGAEVRIINTLHKAKSGASQNKVELPPEEGDETFPSETLHHLGRVSLFLAELKQTIADNDNMPPEDFFELDKLL